MIRKLLTTLAVLTLIIAPLAYYQDVKADLYGSSLIGWWTLDSNDISGTSVLDKSGGGHNGTTINGPTQVAGKLGQALSFNGTNQVVNFGANSLTFIGNLGSGTVCAWMSAPTGGTAEITNGSDAFGDGGGWSWILSVPQGGHIVTQVVFLNTGAAGYVADSGITAVANQWYFVCSVVPQGSVTTYVNGVNKAFTSASPNFQFRTSGQGFQIGQSNGTFFAGKVDDFRIYNRLLSAAEISQLYYQGIGAHQKF